MPMVKRVIRYLKDQPDFDIMYRRRTDPQQKQMPFHVHVDAGTRCEVTNGLKVKLCSSIMPRYTGIRSS